MRGAEGNYAQWLKTGGGVYHGLLLSTANCFGRQLHQISENLSTGRLTEAKEMSERLTGFIKEMSRLVRGIPDGNQFANAGKAVDHFHAHGPAHPKSPPPSSTPGRSLPVEVIRATGEALARHRLMPARAILNESRTCRRTQIMRLKNKTILVTGASKGIGKALALGMARKVPTSLSTIILTGKAHSAWWKKFAPWADWQWPCRRILDAGQIQKMFEFARREHNRLDVLVNNAGITDWTSLFEVTEEKWDWVIDTNLKGTFFCSLEAAKWMRETGGGAVVNVSTNCAALGVKNLVAYATSKAGIHGLTKQLAVELAPYKIRVNTFAPGPTQVDRNLRDDPDYDRNWGSMVPMNRTALPEEMVGPAVFLASEESSYMTGQVFYVDGGWTAQGKNPDR